MWRAGPARVCTIRPEEFIRYIPFTVYTEVYKINWALGWVRLMAVPSLFRFCEISQGSPS